MSVCDSLIVSADFFFWIKLRMKTQSVVFFLSANQLPVIMVLKKETLQNLHFFIFMLIILKPLWWCLGPSRNWKITFFPTIKPIISCRCFLGVQLLLMSNMNQWSPDAGSHTLLSCTVAGIQLSNSKSLSANEKSSDQWIATHCRQR